MMRRGSVGKNEGRIISSWFDTAAREIDIPDLMKFSNYSFRVLAFNKEGDGPLGAPHFCMTAEDVPDAPEGIKALQISPKTVLVSWKPPLRPNGVVERYDLEIKEHSANAFPSLSSASDTLASAFPLSRGRTETKKVKTLPGRKTVSTFQDAVPGWVYEFSVSASTSAGQGQQTAPFILTLEQNVPARIASWGTNLETTVGSSLLLECLRFGLPNPNLTWGDEYNTLINFNDRVVAKDDGSLVISDVTRGDSGKYTCNVANSHGNDAITYSITVRSSPKPPKLQATKASTSNISLQFVVMDDGGSPVRGFLLRLHRVRGNVNDVAIPSDQDVAAQSAVIGGDFDNEIMPTNSFDELIVDGFPKHRPESHIIEVSREINSYTVEGLACGSSYSVAISAWNSAGHGKYSEQIIVRTEGTKPQVPDSRTVLDVNSTYAIFHVDRWTGASCPVLYFVAKYKEEAWKTWAPISRAGKDVRSPIILDDLRPATAYELSIRAVSEAGETVFQHRFFTLNILGVAVAGEASVKGDSDGPSFSDVRIMTPTILSIVAVAVTVASVYVFLRRRRIPEERVEMAQMKGNTYQEYMLKYYTLLGKQAAERASVADDKSE
ncbi:unnamed protein product [Notodromas monacha]|uniref:Down syndrome cell adhesion molecule n=1 Tax=Notodromas monacha TaxID=399045 RepID=A0A7R9GGI2_9CRUS|nr:unnamed protein product [Notodromas monacha]CAG0921872.1 unnamed protein product [Notodromas monacha]